MRRLLISLGWCLSVSLFYAPPVWADVFEDVPEAMEYQLVYSLDLSETGDFARSGVPYQDDTRADWDNNFDRIAYYLKLQRPNAPAQFIFVSGDTFTRSGLELGLPATGSGIFHQTAFDDMTVISNVPEIIQGDGMEGGYVEMWEWNYGPINSAQIPGASNDAFDYGDMPLPGEGMYGSFQIHNIVAGQTLLAYNRWNDAGPSDLGIGNNSVASQEGVVQTDWTFRGNAGAYAVRQLQVLVRAGEPPPPPPILLDSPQPCQVFQRQRGDIGSVEFRGRLTGDGDRVEARFIPTDGGAATGWQEIDDSIRAGFFNGRIRVRSGHYTVELRVLLDGEVVGSQSVDGVGVGEIFIIAGQSNSANHGVPTLTPADPRVCTTDGSTWRTAADPQPIATGSGGSPWPAFGDLFAARYNVPVGIMSVGWGGTSVGQWLPGNERNLFSRLQFAADTFGEDGVRAVLWHQGESDSIINTSAADYASRLSTVIDAMRVHGGWAIPWGIARVGFLPNSPPERIAAVVDGQNMVIDSVPFVFAGPTTDDLVGEVWRYDAVHFNEMGLREHAERWVDSIVLPECHGFAGVIDTMPCDETDFPDAGTPNGMDAGVPTIDGGATAPDDASGVDADDPNTADVAEMSPEMGALDAAVPTPDSDSTLPVTPDDTPTSSSGGGGGCDAVGYDHDRALPGLVCMLIMLLLVRRRSRSPSLEQRSGHEVPYRK